MMIHLIGWLIFWGLSGDLSWFLDEFKKIIGVGTLDCLNLLSTYHHCRRTNHTSQGHVAVKQQTYYGFPPSNSSHFQSLTAPQTFEDELLDLLIFMVRSKQVRGAFWHRATFTKPTHPRKAKWKKFTGGLLITEIFPSSCLGTPKPCNFQPMDQRIQRTF